MSLYPESIAKHHVRHPRCWHSVKSCWYFAIFRSYASSVLSSQETVSFSKTVCLDPCDHNTISGLSDVAAISAGKLIRCCISAVNYNSVAVASIPMPSCVLFLLSPAFTKFTKVMFFLTFLLFLLMISNVADIDFSTLPSLQVWWLSYT